MQIFVGLSVNPEIYFSYDRSDGQQKHRLLDFAINLSGTSGNVAAALFSLGQKSILFGLIGTNGRQEDSMIKGLKPKGFKFVRLEALESTSLSFIPNDSEESIVVGRRGAIIPDLIPKALSHIKNLPQKSCRVLTGLLPVELELGISFLDVVPGWRFFTPNRALCKDKESLIKILPFVDVLVSNLDEHYDIMKSLKLEEISKIHNFGTQFIVVTDEERGGFYSFKGKTGRFNAKIFIDDGYPTGAGDWFLSGLITRCREIKVSPKDLNELQLTEVLDFATTVAGLKVTMLGGTNGPKRNEL